MPANNKMPTDCGCTVSTGGQGRGHAPYVEIIYCPLHLAAPETAKQRDVLLEVVTVALEIADEDSRVGKDVAMMRQALKQPQATDESLQHLDEAIGIVQQVNKQLKDKLAWLKQYNLGGLTSVDLGATNEEFQSLIAEFQTELDNFAQAQDAN